jgi:Cu-Zn family superoxide dismutase
MDSGKRFAVCVLNGNPGSGITGIVKFMQDGAKIKIHATIKGLPAGKHGFHIHEWGDLSKGCATAGPHFNPTKKSHGGPMEDERHVGDLGNIESDGSNESEYFLEDHLIRLEGPNSILGRALVIHENEDDLGKGNFPDSKETGHAGGRIACGVIGLSSEFIL